MDFAGKKITLMGLGLLGRGVGDAEFLASKGAELIVTDLKTEAELAPSLARLKKFENIIYHLGGHRMEDFEDRDLIFRAPNAPLDSPYLAHAREAGVPIEMDASLFAKLSSATIVGITGTRGKSTVTNLIYEIVRTSGERVFLGGNVRDTATLPLVKSTGGGDVVVLELDSWQLQGFEEGAISPHISVWTNFMPDHMNYYQNDMDRYFQDKAAIARFQKPGDFFIAPPEIKEKVEARFGALAGTFIGDATLPADWEISLEGEHNRKHAAYARAAALALGIPDAVIKKTLREVKGLPGRLQLLAEKNGIAFYDDGNATTPEATIVALETLSAKKRPLVLIAGGSDKALDYTKLAPEIAAKVKKIVLLKGNATEKLKALLPTGFSQSDAGSMDEAFAGALAAATQGDIVILSPAATSFGLFKNEYDRGDQFRALVGKL